MLAPPRRSARIAKASTIVNPLAPLPDELILDICENIFPKYQDDRGMLNFNSVEARGTYAALARTCKYLYPFGMRYLYQTFKCGQLGYMGGFLRTLHNHPELASHLRQILVEGYIWPEPQVPPTRSLGMSKRKMGAEVRKLSLPNEKDMLACLEKCPAEVELALLIYNSRDSLQRLERLGISRCHHASHRHLWLNALIHPVQQLGASSYISQFTKLQHLKLSMEGIRFETIAQVMLLPSLKSLSLLSLSAEDEIEDWPVALRTSKVSILHLILCCHVSSALISQLFRSCETITNFQYLLGHSTSDPQQWYTDVLEAASLHSNTIEKFILTTEDLMLAPWRDRWPQVSLFANMENLTELDISYYVLMGKPEGLYLPSDLMRDPTWPGYTESLHDLLPSSLTKLSLQYKRSTMTRGVDYTQQLRDLIRNDSPRHNKLKTISINYNHDVPAGTFPLQLASLDRYFKHRGVEFDYLVRYTMDDEDDMIDIIENLVDLGMEGVTMAGHFVEDGDAMMSPEELYEAVFESFLEEQDREEWDYEDKMMRYEMGWDSDFDDEEDYLLDFLGL